MKPLYLDDLPALEKKAGFASRLSDTPENWPQEITSDLYKQLPFLTDYELMVNLDRAEEQRGFAFGYADVANKTERPEQEHDEAGLPHVRIPVIVEDRQVRPFSTFLDGENVYPLTENRIREHLFNPTTFDLSVAEPKDPSLVDSMNPPARYGYGVTGEIKQASAEDHLFTALGGDLEKAAKEYSHDEKREHKRIARGAARVGAVTGAITGGLKAGPAGALVGGAAGYGGTYLTERVGNRIFRAIGGKSKESFDKTAFKHISKEQWQAIYKSDKIQQMMHEYKDPKHPAVQNRVYELASQIYGYHPKPEPPSAQKMQEMAQKQFEKTQKAMQKKQQKAAVDKVKASFGKTAGIVDAKKPNPGIVGGMKSGITKKLKIAGLDDSLLLAIAPTMRASDKERFFSKLASDVTLQAAFKRNGFFPVLNELANTKIASSSDLLRAVAENVDPTCITVTKLPGGDFLVKSANNMAFNPAEAAGQVVPPEEAAEAIGPDAAQQMQPGQTATAVADPIDDLDIPQANTQGVTEFGEYIVQDKMGNQMLGWVFPETLAWDGQFSPQPVALFTNGSAFALQDGGVSGEFAGKSMQLPMTNPQGEGCFYNISRDGAVATAPVMVRNGMTDAEGGTAFHCMDMFGNPIVVHLSEGLAQPMQVSDNEYAIPSSWKFMTLNGQTQLSGAGEMEAAEQVKQSSQKVTLFWNGSFNLQGGCGIEKVAEQFRYDMDPVTAEFMLGVLGVDGVVAKQKLAEARRNGEVDLYNLKSITLLGEHYKEAVKTASAFLAKVPDLRRDLMKEAAALEDAATVDKVLALNFVNPENLATFVDYLPKLEETSERMAEMLLSSYLGQTEIPEEAVERAMKNMEDVATALRAVQTAGA